MKFLGILFSLIFFSISAKEVSIDTFKIDFKNNERSKKYVTVQNHSKNKSYVEIILEEVILENGKLKFIPVDFSENSMIVSPNKIILQPKGEINSKKKINFINLNNNLNKEKIYRASFFPRIGKEFNPSENNKTGLSVKLLVVYETYLYVTPKHITKDYLYKKTENGIIFENLSNSSILLSKGKECKNNKCEPLSLKRAISGRKLNLTEKTNVELHYNLKFSDGHIEEVIFK